VVFENEGLKKRDDKLNESLKIFANADKNAFRKRVTYRVGMPRLSGMAKTVIIIDECDAIMLKNLLTFYKATDAKNISVIGLTATAFDKLEGEEKSSLETLGYKIYHTCKDDELAEPKINERLELDTIGKILVKIKEHSMLRGVLVYVTGELHDQLSKVAGITPVTEATPAEELCQMNKKNPVEINENRQLFVYPVYLANDKYGMRGVNYRGNITLIIAAPFGDRRERLQGLHRVGRQGDKCCRI
jgi:hypothetical protein